MRLNVHGIRVLDLLCAVLRCMYMESTRDATWQPSFQLCLQVCSAAIDLSRL